MKPHGTQRNSQAEEMGTMMLAWKQAVGAQPNGVISDALKGYGSPRTMAQIERKRNEFLRAYALVRPHMKFLDEILGNTRGVETSKNGPTCSVEEQGGAANKGAGKAGGATTKPHMKLLDEIPGNTKRVETSKNGPTCSVEDQGGAANKGAGKADNATTKEKNDRAKDVAGSNTKGKRRSHQEEGAGRAMGGDGGRQADDGRWSEVKRNPGKKKVQMVCKFFVNGTCWHGAAGTGCRFGHPGPHAQFACTTHADRNQRGHTVRTQHTPSAPRPQHIPGVPRKYSDAVRAAPKRGQGADAVRTAAAEQRSFLDMAQRIVGQLTWLHRTQNQIHAHQHSGPPQTTGQGQPPPTPFQRSQRGPLLTPQGSHQCCS